MKEKYLLLISALLNSHEWMTAQNLSSSLNVSVRTIKNYVSELNHLYPNLIVSSANGYKIQRKVAASIPELSENGATCIPQTNPERCTYIILKLLRSEEPIDMYDLCDELYISMSTLRIVLKRVKRQYSQYNLTMITNDSRIRVEGPEESRRAMLRSIIYNESNNTSFDLASIQEIFDNIDVEFIADTLNDLLWENNYYVTDYSVFNIVLHIVIALDRNMHMTEIEEDFDFETPDFLPENVRSMSNTLSNILSDYFNVSFTDPEKVEFALLFYNRAISIPGTDMINDENLEEYVGPKCMDLINEILSYLSDEYKIEVTQNNSIVSFALHIKNLMIRAKSKQFNRNPLTESIKTSCPMIYDVAVNISSIISSRLGTPLVDDEIAYIAFHIGNAIEMQMAYTSKVSILLICPTYYNMNHDLCDRLMERFGSEIIIENVIISESAITQYDGIDLILSTVPVKSSINNYLLQIQPFLTMGDVRMIEKALMDIKSTKRKEFFLTELKNIIIPEFFEHIDKKMSKEETLHYMCRKLFDAGYCTKDFEKEIFTREELSSTMFTNFAIPHTMQMRENKSCMYILINDQPINWGNGDVNLVIMLCFNVIDRPIFYRIFEPISNYLLKSNVISNITSCKTYDEFMKILKDIE